MQYRETDFNFVSRLMEQEGIGYYFRHTDGHNTMVLTDSTGKHTPVDGYEKLSFIAPMQQVKPDTEHVQRWDFGREIQPGVYVHDDYDLERPSVELKTSKPLPRGYTPSDYEIYDYPGCYIQRPDGEQYASVRIDELGTQFELAQAATNARGLTVGALLTLEHHPRDDQNREYLIVGASYDLSFERLRVAARGRRHELPLRVRGDAERRSSSGRSGSRRSRSCRGRRRRSSSGPAGEEIYTDKYGRVKVQFHWDRRGKKDENSSCWIRVSHPWAGKNWGAIATPRIGQEVIVDFLEGDPDQPIITGRVYNAEQMPPYDLPANKTQSGVKSRSSKGGGPANFNEIRFEDKKGSEQLFIHAEKNQDIEVENDETHWVGHDRKKTIDHDETTPRQARSDGDGRQQRDDHGSREADGDRRQERDDHDSREPHRDGRPERDDHASVATAHHGEQERDRDRRAAADAHRRCQRDDHASARRRRSRSGRCRRSRSVRSDDERRRESVDHDWRQSVDECRRQSVDQRRRGPVDEVSGNASMTVGKTSRGR